MLKHGIFVHEVLSSSCHLQRRLLTSIIPGFLCLVQKIPCDSPGTLKKDCFAHRVPSGFVPTHVLLTAFRSTSSLRFLAQPVQNLGLPISVPKSGRTTLQSTHTFRFCIVGLLVLASPPRFPVPARSPSSSLLVPEPARSPPRSSPALLVPGWLPSLLSHVPDVQHGSAGFLRMRGILRSFPHENLVRCVAIKLNYVRELARVHFFAAAVSRGRLASSTTLRAVPLYPLRLRGRRSRPAPPALPRSAYKRFPKESSTTVELAAGAR